MSPEKITLKDIAERCGVTPTVVSAILNGRNSRITCCAEKRELILKTAREMNYRANFFARSIKMKQVPIIGLLLHMYKNRSLDDTDSYVTNCLHQMTLAFNRHQLEVLFIPYSSEDEQLTRVQHLLASGLLGGVVTNIIPESHQRICAFLAGSRLPYMILGAPLMENIYCAYPVTTCIAEKCLALAAERNLSGCYHVLSVNGEIRFVPYPFPNDYIWHGRQLTQSEIMPEMNSALFSADLPSINFLRTTGFSPRHLLIIESSRHRSLLPSGSEAILVNNTVELAAITSYVDEALCGWMLNDRPPQEYRKVVPASPSCCAHTQID